MRGSINGTTDTASTGFSLRGYHEESFSFENLPVPDVPAPAGDGRGEDDHAPSSSEETGTSATYSIEFVRSGVTATCTADESILNTAYAAGLRPPASCTLLCCSKPLSDLRIDA